MSLAASLLALQGALVSIEARPVPPEGAVSALENACTSVFGALPAESTPPAEEEAPRATGAPPPQQHPSQVNSPSFPRCRVDSGDTPPEAVLSVVIVEWEDEGEWLRVRLRLGDRAPETARALAFDGESSEVERWEAVGLVAAALVNARLRSEQPDPKVAQQPVEEPTDSAHPQDPKPRTSEDPFHSFVSFGGGAQGDLLMGASLAKLQPMAQLEWSGHWSGVALRPLVGLDVLGGVLARPTSTSSVARTGLRPSLGVGFWPVSGSVEWGVLLAGVLACDRVVARVGEESEARWLLRGGLEWGTALRVLGEVRSGTSEDSVGRLGAELGVRAQALAPRAAIRLENVALGRLSWLSAQVGLSVVFSY